MPSNTLSPSESFGQPFVSTVAPSGVLGQVSIPLSTVSLSSSLGHPRPSTLAPAGVAGHSSFPSETPSRSSSAAGAPLDWKNDNPADPTRWVTLPVVNVLCVWGV